MKHDKLCAIAHNLADSLASGLCFVIGYWNTDVFGEAAAGDGVLEVDFLNGRIVRGTFSENLRGAVVRFQEVLPSFCTANGADISDFITLRARFDTTTLAHQVSVEVTDTNGKCTITEYSGVPLKRLRVLDPIGRVRRIPRLNRTIGGEP
ncbi:hypothetical protein [Devosia sp. Leaf64]|uniref:hypothetical protein n=1 Tax=Devosia sp. Leaf64 TaxID=1736229 RepID=UPI0007140BD0|nr:hypothetical protein [Devosia sp. Leaf64]KQN75068.1 hypothetical protein ASE94_01755 [Devosia sp. Leaf64]